MQLSLPSHVLFCRIQVLFSVLFSFFAEVVYGIENKNQLQHNLKGLKCQHQHFFSNAFFFWADHVTSLLNFIR